MGKEINAILGAQTILIWTFAITFNTYLLFAVLFCCQGNSFQLEEM